MTISGIWRADMYLYIYKVGVLLRERRGEEGSEREWELARVVFERASVGSPR